MNGKHKIRIYDTTLRDGTQSKDLDLNRGRKIEVLRRLVDMGVDYVELGWPGSNEEDMQVFWDAARMHLRKTKVAAFGSTRRINLGAEADPNLAAIVNSKAPVATIYGKTDIDHVRYQLNATPEENLAAIADSIRFLKSNQLEVFYDAEHFFDGCKKDAAYALDTLAVAAEAGADCLILCDTNGGCLPWEIEAMVRRAMEHSQDRPVEWGIHPHNDSGVAVANALIAVKCGVTQVQGTVNGYGERAGNANLCEIIPALMLKMDLATNYNLKQITQFSRDFDKIARVESIRNAPYVGENAFAHKGGIHVDAMRKFEEQAKGKSAYEHIDPHWVGNKRQYILSELSGKSNIIEAIRFFNFDVPPDDPRIIAVLQEVEDMRKQGYNIAGLEAESFLLMDRYLGLNRRYFEITSWSVETRLLEKLRSSTAIMAAVVRGRENEALSSGVTIYTDEKSTGNKKDYGPVSALYKALTKLLIDAYPHIFQEDQCVQLLDYSARVVELKSEESVVRVRVKFSYSRQISGGKRPKYQVLYWETVGVSSNIMEASVEAIDKAFHYIIRITDKSLTELLDETATLEDIPGLRGENFEFDVKGIELLHRIGNTFRKKQKSRSRRVEVEAFIAYLEKAIRKKADPEVAGAIVNCILRFEDDPAFLAPDGAANPELTTFFRDQLDTLYESTKIGKYNRQFEHAAKCLGTLMRDLKSLIRKMELDPEESGRFEGHIIGTLEAMALMFERYWQAQGEGFYARVRYWCKD